MKNFVKYSVHAKKVFFKNLIVNQLNDEKQREQQQSQTETPQNYSLSPECTDHSIHRLLSGKSTYGFKSDAKQLREHCVVLDIQFIVECVMLALLDLDGFRITFFLFLVNPLYLLFNGICFKISLVIRVI